MTISGLATVRPVKAARWAMTQENRILAAKSATSEQCRRDRVSLARVFDFNERRTGGHTWKPVGRSPRVLVFIPCTQDAIVNSRIANRIAKPILPHTFVRPQSRDFTIDSTPWYLPTEMTGPAAHAHGLSHSRAERRASGRSVHTDFNFGPDALQCDGMCDGKCEIPSWYSVTQAGPKPCDAIFVVVRVAWSNALTEHPFLERMLGNWRDPHVHARLQVRPRLFSHPCRDRVKPLEEAFDKFDGAYVTTMPLL